MQILLSGSSGLVGRALLAQLPRSRHGVTRLLRFGPASGTEVPAEAGQRSAAWDPQAGLLDRGVLSEHEVVICLNGTNITGKRWDRAFKKELLDSRVQPTRLLAETMAALPPGQRPRLFISCSAIGYYGTRPLTPVQDESAPSGGGYLAEICRQWEAAAAPAEQAGIRVVRMRLGIVLASDGGPLSAMVEAFNKGLGAVIGSGRQMMSWVCIHDIAPAVAHVIATPGLSGAVNFVARHPVSNAEMTRAVAAVMGKHVGPPLPGFAARLILGEMADELLLGSQNVVPKKLSESGFQFQHTELLPTLRLLLQGESSA